MLKKEAVKILYERHYDEIYSYILKKVKLPEKAADITEDVFIEVFMMIDTEDSEKFWELGKKAADNACEEYERQIRAAKREKKSSNKKVRRRISLVIAVLMAILSIILKLGYASQQGKITWIEWAWQRHMTIQMGMEDVVEEDFDFIALNIIAGELPYGTSDLLEVGTDAKLYRNLYGIDSIGYIVDGAVSENTDPERTLFVAWIEVASEDYVEIIIEEMKQNLKKEGWSYVNPTTMEEMDHWDNISVDDFSFYANGEYILVSYSSEEEVDGKKLRSSKQMEKIFDKMVKIKRNNY